ncbi:MAG: CHAT domain-containing protein [Cytophagales bacterium]|nr:CHAT domain-containing protein [Cytophagales bacterium]
MFSDLPGTEEEVKSIESVLTQNQWEVDANYGAEASERKLKAQTDPGILHIATHGFFLQQDNFDGVNSMIRSGIILSGVNKPNASSDDDGVLTAYEATNLKLDSTYLVVLSACETGLGEIKNGEGVYGLQRGFAVAGARYLLMSLWKVDDFATQVLIQDFYNNWLSGMEIHKAFANAQVALRKKHPHPFYWGAFILLGN